MDQRREAVRGTYDTVAKQYADALFTELDHKPLDRALLAVLAERLQGRGSVADVGCGPGQIARALHDAGLPAQGFDLSPRMIEVARRLSPDIPFDVADMLALPVTDGSLAGIAAFYSIIHFPPEMLPQVFREFHRALARDGLALTAFHRGDEQIHRDEWWGFEVDLDGYYYPTALVEAALRDVGFVVEARLERAPDPEYEYPSERAYLLARKVEKP